MRDILTDTGKEKERKREYVGSLLFVKYDKPGRVLRELCVCYRPLLIIAHFFLLIPPLVVVLSLFVAAASFGVAVLTDTPFFDCWLSLNFCFGVVGGYCVLY